MKKCIYILALSVVLITIWVMDDTFGLYEDNLRKEVDGKTASFIIKVNNSIINGDNRTFEVNDIVLTEGSRCDDTKLAPGSKGYFDVVIDTTDVDVAFRYDISLDFTHITNDNIQIEGTESLGGTGEFIKTAESTYSSIVPLEEVENDEQITIRVYLNWVNNDEDVESDFAVSGQNLSIPINTHFIQYLGESIVPYVEE